MRSQDRRSKEVRSGKEEDKIGLEERNASDEADMSEVKDADRPPSPTYSHETIRWTAEYTRVGGGDRLKGGSPLTFTMCIYNRGEEEEEERKINVHARKKCASSSLGSDKGGPKNWHRRRGSSTTTTTTTTTGPTGKGSKSRRKSGRDGDEAAAWKSPPIDWNAIAKSLESSE
jgi:hypothetical protein